MKNAAGLMTQWRRDILFSTGGFRFSRFRGGRRQPLNLRSYSVHFIVYLTCIAISFLVFVIEILVKIWSQRPLRE
jgi:hypothetical protein